MIPAAVTANFRFYQYGLDGSNAGGKIIDSRRRKGELLNIGLFDEKEGLLARNGMETKDIENPTRAGITYTVPVQRYIEDLSGYRRTPTLLRLISTVVSLGMQGANVPG